MVLLLPPNLYAFEFSKITLHAIGTSCAFWQQHLLLQKQFMLTATETIARQYERGVTVLKDLWPDGSSGMQAAAQDRVYCCGLTTWERAGIDGR
jgi:hypothetical protein